MKVKGRKVKIRTRTRTRKDEHEDDEEDRRPPLATINRTFCEGRIVASLSPLAPVSLSRRRLGASRRRDSGLQTSISIFGNYIIKGKKQRRVGCSCFFDFEFV